VKDREDEIQAHKKNIKITKLQEMDVFYYSIAELYVISDGN
jgi:hypothetical protein